MELNDLVKISRYYGSNPDYVLEGGGNTSCKDKQDLFIKASGIRLAEIDENGFIKLNRDMLGSIWEKDYPAGYKEREALFLKDLRASVSEESGHCGNRPSVETLLHNLFPYRYVVHTHPAIVNGITCSIDGEKETAEIFGTEVLWIPTVNPGYILALTVKNSIDSYIGAGKNYPHILFLQNHGLLVAADTVEKIKKLTESVISRIESKIIKKPDFSPVKFDREKASQIAPVLRMLLMASGTGETGSICTFYTDREVSKLLYSGETFNRFSLSLTPDHIVYSGYKPLFIEEKKSPEDQYGEIKTQILRFLEKEKTKPKIIAVRNLGIFAWGVSTRDSRAALKLFTDAVKVFIYSESFGGINPLPEDQTEFIRKWEVESYRRKVMLKSEDKGILKERIAVVTGGAQGIGEGIAKGLLNEGCNVVIADINAETFDDNAVKGYFKTIAADVTDEESVKSMIVDTVLEYGGIDLLVSNAGVLKAGSLDAMDYKTFNFVTGVNYNGYFLCTKYASSVMKIQNRFNPRHLMDIIQINSKSGLSGSKRNSAYAGSKFGGIGLTQSFALELVEYNIKVNAICPGNFFDGPLWSDPERGLFAQYLKAGKVPGAESMEDVRKFYESRVPMKRGCLIEDINRALRYLVEQEYETGQAVPVTGGQVMLK
ncbi:MAG: SDR family NAD(P)-dependent oxidoreductase [Spirochaetes bacterium]|nr:SDR family NAD(P)-dependent oxidoreductase [Spirochaetota bacterium]